MAQSSNFLLVASVLGIGLGVAACGGAGGAVQAPAVEPLPISSAQPAPGSGDQPSARPSITAEACEANSGSVVGDIGDGAIHRPEYRCVNGAKPTANISSPAGGPIAIEGSVCCPR